MYKINFLVAFVVLSMLSACAAKPQLTYSPVNENREGEIRFVLPKSLILVRSPKAAGGRPEVDSVPSDLYADAKSLLVRGEVNFLQETNILNVAFLDNTAIVSSVGFDVVSKSNDFIKLVSSVVPVVASGGGGAFVETVLTTDEQQALVDLPSNEATWGYKLTYASGLLGGKDGSIPFEDFMSSLSLKSSVFPTSHCKNATLTLYDKKAAATYSYAIKVADPSRVVLVKVPNKGSIKMHTSCGFDLTVTSSGGAVDYDSLNSLVKLANDLKSR